MEDMLRDHARVRIEMNHPLLKKAIGWGLLSGLAATLVMDLVLIGGFAAVGMPVFACYTVIGETLARFFSIQGGTPADSILLGLAAHYLIGPLIGASFAVLAASARVLRTASRRKLILFAVLYAEILSQPLLALSPILLKMTAAETLQWFGGAVMMHLIWGIGFGAMLNYGLRRPAAANHN
jgi:hypothetical protein